MTKLKTGDFVETIYNVNGFIIDIKQGKHGEGVFIAIATADMRIFYCPIADVKESEK